jgi:hypothetical protein
MKLTDRLWGYFLQNPVAWLLAALLAVVVYANYKLGDKLDTVCDAIELPDEAIDKPKTLLEKAQSVCEDRIDTGNMPED